jgi:hypothetical protein
MKIISFVSARTTWLFPVEEFTPAGGGDGKEIIRRIVERYKFSHPPENPTREEIDKNGLKFSSGQFQFDGELVTIDEFIAYNDGIVAAANTTERSEGFLADIHKFLMAEFKFREITSVIKKVNLSTLVVEFDSSLSAIMNGHQTIMDIVAGNLNSLEKTQYPLELARVDLVLNKDPEFRPAHTPRFIIEKRANTAYSQNRYYSSAPIATKKHLAVLEAIESALATRPS